MYEYNVLHIFTIFDIPSSAVDLIDDYKDPLASSLCRFGQLIW